MTALAPGPPSRALKRIGWSIVALGLCLVALSATFLVIDISSAVRAAVGGTSYRTPVDQSIQLGAGDYVVYQQTGTASGGRISGNGGYCNGCLAPLTLQPRDVQVTGPDGAAIATGYPRGADTLTRNGEIYSGAVSFHAAHSGRYEIRVHPAGAETVIISKDIVSEVLSGLIWVLGLVAGGLLLVIGFILLIVHWTRRSRVNRPPPPGWYTDAASPGGWRWWTGSAWAAPPVA
jgi:hypothetical protein